MLEKKDIVAAQWGNRVAGKSVDSAKIRPEIYRSWIQCRTRDVDPFGDITRNPDVDGLRARSTELVEAMQGFHAGWRKSGIGGADGKHGLMEYLQTHVAYIQY